MLLIYLQCEFNNFFWGGGGYSQTSRFISAACVTIWYPQKKLWNYLNLIRYKICTLRQWLHITNLKNSEIFAVWWNNPQCTQFIQSCYKLYQYISLIFIETFCNSFIIIGIWLLVVATSIICCQVPSNVIQRCPRIVVN